MKYFSVDIETTGLNPEHNDILEIGIIFEDTKLKLPRLNCPTFHCYIWQERYYGEPFALAMNADIFKTILKLKKEDNIELLLRDYQVPDRIAKFIAERGITDKAVVAGKNFSGFDNLFLSKLSHFTDTVKFHHRVLDPSTLFTSFEDDVVPPDLRLCKQRAGLGDVAVSHQALDDAWDVIETLRTKY